MSEILQFRRKKQLAEVPDWAEAEIIIDEAGQLEIRRYGSRTALADKLLADAARAMQMHILSMARQQP